MTMHLGDPPGPLQLDLTRGYDFRGQIQYQDPPGTPAPWPSGLTAWFKVFKVGTAYEETWPITVDGEWLRWNVDSTLVDVVPSGATAQLVLDWDIAGLDPIVWRKGRVVFCD